MVVAKKDDLDVIDKLLDVLVVVGPEEATMNDT